MKMKIKILSKYVRREIDDIKSKIDCYEDKSKQLRTIDDSCTLSYLKGKLDILESILTKLNE